MNSSPLALHLDADGGALLAGFNGNRLVLHDPALRCLDVLDAPALEVIDLASLARPVTLTVRGCPRLRSIRLPATAGNTVRVDFGTLPENLSIDGPLWEVDGCWDGGEFRLCAPKQAGPLDGCFIGRALPESLPGALVLVQPSLTELVLEDPALRQLVVVDAPALRRVVLGQLDGALFQHCPRLQQVQAQAARLRLTDCAAVAAIGGGGRSLGVRGGAADALSVSGPWTRLALGECGARSLEAPLVEHVTLRALPALEALRLAADARVRVSGPVRVQGLAHAGVELDEPAVTSLAGQAARGDAAALAVLSAWCDRARSPRARLLGLRGLARALDDAADSRARIPHHHAATAADLLAASGSEIGGLVLWRLRCRLNIDPRDGLALDDAAVTQRALSGWHWDLPRDLAQEGWDADLALWLACRQLPEAARFARVLGRSRQQIQIATLARAAGKHALAPETREVLAELLLKALRRSPPPLSPKEQRAHLAQAEHVLHAVLATGRRALAEAFADYVTGRINELHCVPLLRQLAMLGVGRARLHLMTLARSAPRHVREQALAAALAPVRARLFAEPEFTKETR